MRRLPLRDTLAIAMSGLTVLVLVSAVLVANREVRRSTRLATEERLGRVVEQLGRLASTSAEQRRNALLLAGRDPALIGLLRGEAVPEDSVLAVLQGLRAASDEGLPIQVWDAAGDPVFTDPAHWRRPEGRLVRAAPLDTVPAYGAFHGEAGETLYYSTAPVRDGGDVLGWIVQRRRLGNPRTAAEIQNLIAREARVLFSHPATGEWLTLSGTPVVAPLPTPPPPDSTVVYRGPDGQHYLAEARAVANTPWVLLVEMPLAGVDAASEAFLRRMALAGLVLILVAVALAWVVSRRLTRPLRELALASDAFAAGDLTRRVAPATEPEEIGRLAAAFNEMAEQVARSHRVLEQRLEEARQLATRLETAHDAADHARVAAEAADREKSRFLAIMSHEIRTPINAVLGLAEILELDTTTPDARSEYVRRIRRAARQLARLVDDVLDLSKVDSGGVLLHKEDTSVRDAVSHVVALLEEDVRRTGLTIEVDVDAALTCRADPRRLEQILLNLVANAVKFTATGGWVRVRGEPPADGAGTSLAPGLTPEAMVRVHVEDNGIGIPPAELDRIFEPFIQAEAGYTRSYGGTGLGLSISRRLARLMRGDVTVESTPGTGSRFTLSLPPAVDVPVPAE